MFGGGNRAVPRLTTTELFNPMTDTFAPDPEWTSARALLTTLTLPDSRVLIMGGSDGIEYATVLVFDPATSAFTMHPRMLSRGLARFTATLLANGRVVVGGQDSGGIAAGRA